MWSHLSDASRRRGRQRGEALMERRPQRGTNRGRSGMVARSTDGHKTNASLGAEHLEGDLGLAEHLDGFRMVMLSFFSFYRYSFYRAYDCWFSNNRLKCAQNIDIQSKI